MTQTRPDYLAYLLRLWRVSTESSQPSSAPAVWRASLEDPHTGQRLGFASPEELFDFLRTRMELTSGEPDASGQPDELT